MEFTCHFHLSFFVVCGGSLWGSLQVKSPSYPNAYPNSIDCYWYCTGLPSDRMNLTLVEFDIELANDYVTVYEGATMTSPPLLQFTGPQKNDTKLSFVTSTKTMLIHFHSNGADANRYKGFSFLYKANNPAKEYIAD